MRIEPSKSAFVAAVTAVWLGGGLFVGEASAAIPQDGVYTACYMKSGGAIRIIDASQKCKSSETRITWNEEGQQGPQGEQGLPGIAVQADPPCFDNVNRYVDCGNGTVTDTVTGLIWLQNANCFEQQNYAAANQAAAGLQHGDCGLSDHSSPGDWRLPTIAEWEETVVRAKSLGCVDGNAPSLTDTAGTACYIDDPQPLFSGVQSELYWPSTSPAGVPSEAWYLNTYNGYVGVVAKSNGNYVWPVRGRQ